jgi:hypothetical protein
MTKEQDIEKEALSLARTLPPKVILYPLYLMLFDSGIFTDVSRKKMTINITNFVNDISYRLRLTAHEKEQLKEFLKNTSVEMYADVIINLSE